jgi:putative oxidoreductase
MRFSPGLRDARRLISARVVPAERNTMSQAQFTRERATPPVGGPTFDGDLNFLVRWAAPLGLLARAMLAYIFLVEGVGKIAGYAGVADYMQAHGVDGRLLPLVILTELGGGLLVLFGLKTRWAASALFGFCLLTALLFHLGADQTIHLQKNIAMAGGFLTLAILGPGAWSLDAWRARAG